MEISSNCILPVPSLNKLSLGTTLVCVPTSSISLLFIKYELSITQYVYQVFACVFGL